jgi:hypothetical protein
MYIEGIMGLEQRYYMIYLKMQYGCIGTGADIWMLCTMPLDKEDITD